MVEETLPGLFLSSLLIPSLWLINLSHTALTACLLFCYFHSSIHFCTDEPLQTDLSLTLSFCHLCFISYLSRDSRDFRASIWFCSRRRGCPHTFLTFSRNQLILSTLVFYWVCTLKLHLFSSVSVQSYWKTQYYCAIVFQILLSVQLCYIFFTFKSVQHQYQTQP